MAINHRPRWFSVFSPHLCKSQSEEMKQRRKNSWEEHVRSCGIKCPGFSVLLHLLLTFYYIHYTYQATASSSSCRSHWATRIYLRISKLEVSVHLLFILLLSLIEVILLSSPSACLFQVHIAVISESYNSELPGYWCLKLSVKCTTIYTRK